MKLDLRPDEGAEWVVLVIAFDRACSRPRPPRKNDVRAKLVLNMQSTLDNRIANAQGAFWEPSPWGEEEMAYLNEHFRAADTRAMGRQVYEAVIRGRKL